MRLFEFSICREPWLYTYQKGLFDFFNLLRTVVVYLLRTGEGSLIFLTTVSYEPEEHG
jgi:hypothetical protein